MSRKRKAVADTYNPYLGFKDEPIVPKLPVPPSYLLPATYSAAGSGSASNPINLDSPEPKPKRARKAKDPSAPVPEKRGAVLKKNCPKNIMERAFRVRDQR